MITSLEIHVSYSNYRFYYKTILSLLPFGLLGFCWLVLSMEFWVLACLFLSVKNTLVPWSQISAISFTGHNYMKGSGRFPLFACDSPTARVSTGVSELTQDVSLGTLGSDALQARAYCDPAPRQQTRGSGGNKVLASSQQPHTHKLTWLPEQHQHGKDVILTHTRSWVKACLLIIWLHGWYRKDADWPFPGMGARRTFVLHLLLLSAPRYSAPCLSYFK